MDIIIEKNSFEEVMLREINRRNPSPLQEARAYTVDNINSLEEYVKAVNSWREWYYQFVNDKNPLFPVPEINYYLILSI